jgi:outer membrane protein assembly factor BamA
MNKIAAALAAFLLLALSGFVLAQSKIIALRIQGNYETPDSEVIKLAGIKVGDPFTENTVAEVERRLRRSGRFESVEVKVRYRSLGQGGDVALIIQVKEKPSLPSKLMVGPILGLSDEYGFTFGAQIAVVDPLGLADSKFLPLSKLYFPLTWGGTRQAGVEAEFDLGEFDMGRMVNRLNVYAGRTRRENPHYKIGDDRVELSARFATRLRFFTLGLGGGWTSVKFGGLDEEFTDFGIDFALDTRKDANLPGDAVYLGAGWKRVSYEKFGPVIMDDVEPAVIDIGARADTNIYTIDARAYKRLFGRPIIASQFYYQEADHPLAPYLKPFLGGGATLRGYSPGEFVGDSIALASLELRWPLTKVLERWRAGIHFFFDSGAVFDQGQHIGDADFHYGLGGGGFIFAAVFGLKVDIASDLEGGYRAHVSSGFRF